MVTRSVHPKAHELVILLLNEMMETVGIHLKK
jgi:hypothetical protein